ncbi:IPT/TIG domain-containing protein [Heterostelium album PN500]|uniref:IPT/TIG domain-containing protein n=1 Tax=Heterostelium pallidum (strain ATCC 26659 / Pp 5 / PN500) TaxID=670386 RepID=D3B0S1_HETP5|nr:IPT/TIG domain-containing protein [Heterostelium album PN500]EFA84895.1 IPT/TIG domain-containing protein [Heterostelium album PN500]|eukprot:XP_020437005.1 IPT/TIG domain-containing protein [Heterostelium album PN500]
MPTASRIFSSSIRKLKLPILLTRNPNILDENTQLTTLNVNSVGPKEIDFIRSQLGSITKLIVPNVLWGLVASKSPSIKRIIFHNYNVNDHCAYSKTNSNRATGYAHIKSKHRPFTSTLGTIKTYAKKIYDASENHIENQTIEETYPNLKFLYCHDSSYFNDRVFYKEYLFEFLNKNKEYRQQSHKEEQDMDKEQEKLKEFINEMAAIGVPIYKSSECKTISDAVDKIGFTYRDSGLFTNHTGVVLDISSLSNEFKYAGLKLLTLTINDPHSNVSRSTTSNMPIEPIITKTTTTSSDLGGPVTISGDLFDSVNSFGFKTIKTIQIGSQSCLNVVDLSVYSNSFICQLGPISKMSNNQQFTNIPILVTIEGATSNNSTILFNYDVPSISNIYQNGSKIYFEGELLGYSSQISKTWISVSNSTMINNSFVPTQIDIESLPLVSNRSSVNRKWIVQFRIPNNFKSGLFNFFISNHNNQLISNSVQLSIKADIGEISTPQTKGDTLTIFGALFGNPISIKFTNRPDIKNTSNPMLIDSSTIIVNISPGSGQNIDLELNVNGVITSKSFRYHEPTITSVTPISRHGGVITISGSNYDVNNTSVFIFNTIGCNTTTIVNDTTIYCQVKLNGSDTLKFGENLNVTIIVNTQIVISSTLNITSITGGQETNILRIVLPIERKKKKRSLQFLTFEKIKSSTTLLKPVQ